MEDTNKDTQRGSKAFIVGLLFVALLVVLAMIGNSPSGQESSPSEYSAPAPSTESSESTPPAEPAETKPYETPVEEPAPAPSGPRLAGPCIFCTSEYAWIAIYEAARQGTQANRNMGEMLWYSDQSGVVEGRPGVRIIRIGDYAKGVTQVEILEGKYCNEIVWVMTTDIEE